MQGFPEFEEGEAYCYKHVDDNIDLDSLSYIDERIQHVLGHFRKDFEGAVSAKHLGPKFGDYGSFLPTCERSPPFRSHTKTPQRHYSSTKSPSNLHMETAFHNSKAPSNMPLMRLGTASHNAHPFHNLRGPSVDVSVKKDAGISSNAVMEKCTSKDDCANKSENSTDQRTLKLRINMLAKDKAAIYSGLGLDNSPSSSMGNSPEESEGLPLVSQETPEKSPTGIVQVMTSFTIPGGVLISPLHDSLLYLIRKENVIGDSRPMSSCNGHQEHFSVSTDESDSLVGDRHLLKKRKVGMVGQSEKQHTNDNCSENDMTLHMKKRLGNSTPDRKEFLSYDLKCTPLSSSIGDAGETVEYSGKAFEVSKEVNKDGLECRMVSIEAVKEDSLESISGQGFEKIERKNTGNRFMKKVLEHKPEISQNNKSTNLKNNGKCNAFLFSKKAEHDAVKCKVDLDTQKRETTQKGKATYEGKTNSKGKWSPGKVMSAAKKDITGASNNAMVTDKKSAGFGDTSCKSKMLKIKSLKGNKVRDFLKGKKSERKVDGIDPADCPPINKATINANLDNIEEKGVHRVKVKEQPSGHKVDNQLLDVPSVKDDTSAFPIAESQPTLEMVPPPAAAAPQLIEDWVCCDSCEKWRLLPTGLKPDQLPDKWLCSMMYWLPGMNRCDILEEETTKAIYNLCQMPISEGQSNVQSHATGPENGAADALQFDLNHKKSSSGVMFDLGKKKRGIKEKTKSGINNDIHQLSNRAKNHAQESGKNRSLNDMNQQPADSNCLKKSSSKHLSGLNNLIEEKGIPKEKEKQMNGVDRNHVKLKGKMDANEHRSGIPKKSKTEDVSYTDKQPNPGMHFEKVGPNSRNGLPTKASGKNMRKYDEHCLSEDLQDTLVVPVKKGNRAQSSSGDGSLGVMNSNKNDCSIKKRKSKDWLDNEKHNDTMSLQDDMCCGEEGNVRGFMKEKKYRVLNTEAKPVSVGDDKLSIEGGMKRVFLSNSRDQTTVTTELKSVDKAQQTRKLRKNIASRQALDCFDTLRKDLGSGQLSLAATSSSSKVSGSQKARPNLEHVRGSPVECVTSSPLRASNLDKCILAVGDTSEKDNARKGGLSSMSFRNREGKLSVKMKEGRISRDPHPRQHGGNGSHHEEKMKKNNKENALSWQKSGRVTSLRVKEKDKGSGSEVSRDTMKASALENGYSKNGVRYESPVDPCYHASVTETRNDAKNSSPMSKAKIDNLSKKNSLRHWSSETGKRAELKQKDFENSVLKVDAPCSTNRKVIYQQNLIQNFEEENKANPVRTGSRDGKAKVLSSSEGEAKRETLYVGSRIASGSQQGDMSNGYPVHASGNGDVAKLVRNSADVSCKAGVNRSSGNFMPAEQLSVSSPMTTNSNQTAFSILEEATKLKDSADHYKSSEFEFESNETYFKAALKFLHGASLLEHCPSESSKLGETSQMEIYATTAKLFESCAHKYERSQEMAAAALAYKCMEVVYMRMVYCKHSSIDKDRHELQSILQMVSQGESPSSFASDIDNLNNVAAIDKATLPMCNNTHVADNQVISARTCPNIVRLLDFNRDIDFAMEASRKCQSTFRIAKLIMEEAGNMDCITSIREVVDFSFQDVDKLVHLVLIATEAITRAGLGGARE
ncbi:cysteine-tryptophan domain-containing zinc finger protein 7-like [Gastrolobium bilobum]|uniref:cysteine-tryptophan domain-containing zinc finger protein 7-like n=1 Tax=Gastrolobium bilobum TaxID=150636 RepID=UPI002AB2C6DF|nr:cysteine-tryptophan domain-containing zinc finger protein 7-like [Gastrolobium bilobum]